ncbi:MAG: group 1 glycosyl transferase [Gammaproteobacteria bacterium]|nr:group 1 glycosyl transferase [Gammaproteobacteria bacterium]
MRVALVCPVLAEGGAGRAMTQLANHWCASDHEVFLFTFEDTSAQSFYPLHPNLKVRHLDLQSPSQNFAAALLHNVSRVLRVRRALRAVSPQLTVSFLATANVGVLLASLGCGWPVVVSERVHPAHEPLGAAWHALRRVTYPLARSVVVQTSEIAQYLADWGLKNTTVIPNPVVAPPTTGSAPRISKPYVLALGRLHAQKSFDLLINAFARIAPNNTQWSLAIAGEGPEREALTALITQLKLPDRIQLMGQQQDIGGLLDNADIFALSSSYEGFPNALCEAMGAGVASVATDCPSGPRDLVAHDENGLLVPNGDTQAMAQALQRLMNDAPLRAQLASAATAAAEDYAPVRVMSQWDELLEDAVPCAG